MLLFKRKNLSKMSFKILLAKKEKKENSVLYYNVEESAVQNIMNNLKQNNKVLSEKKELLQPMLDNHQYGFFYEISSAKETNIFCIFASVEENNVLFNDIPFLKFKAQKFKKDLETKNIELSNGDLENWFNIEKFKVEIDNIDDQFKTKVDFRPIISSVVTLVELFQNKANDSTKTKVIENLKKNFSPEEFQIILDIGKLLNEKIEDLVIPFTTFEKQYSSRLSDL